MKNVRVPKFLYIYAFIGLMILTSAIICIKIYSFDTKDMVLFSVTVMSLVISFIAFIISVQTYLSIDSVNVITQMEGNVLENENYVTSVTSLLNEYDMNESQEVGEAIFRNLESRFTKKSKTAIEFATNLQYFIDIIVFFPSLIHAPNENQQNNIDRMNRLLRLIEKRKEALLAISTGNLTLIDETVKLINCVIHYQKLIHTDDYKIAATLLEVRGTMLRNAVTQTVYYNYLGLFYNKKAMNIMRRNPGLEHADFFDILVLRKVIRQINALENEEAELFTMYLLESKKAFQKALDNSKDDVMWNGFIKYNDARSTFFLQIIQPDYEGEGWKEMMDGAILARCRLNHLISDMVLTEAPNHLQRFFKYQEYLAKLVKINILIATKENITDGFQQTQYAYPGYRGLKEDRIVKESYSGEFKNIKKYQERILSFLEFK